MADTGSNPEDEYADDEYADHDAEDLDEPFASTRIPDDEPEADVLEQRQEVPYDQDEDEPWWDEDKEEDEDEVRYDEGELWRVIRRARPNRHEVRRAGDIAAAQPTSHRVD